MPYSDKEKQREAQRRSMAKAREVKPDTVKPSKEVKCETPDVKPCDPLDWSDRRNYTDAYLRSLDSQGYELTEASAVAMRSHRVTDPSWLRQHSLRSGAGQETPIAMRQVGDYLVPQGLTVDICKRLLRLPASDAPLVTMLMAGDTLERMQRLIGGLGNHAEGVWLGEHTLKEIGEIIGVAKPQELPHTAPVMQTPGVWQVAVYDPARHKAGDWVRMWVNGRWELKRVPDLDVEGQPIP